MVSFLENVDKKIINKMLEEHDVKTIKQLSKSIIEDFQDILESCKDDIFTQMFFTRLLENENSMIFSAYEADIEGLYVFAYDQGSYYTYYVADEIKKIIKKILKI